MSLGRDGVSQRDDIAAFSRALPALPLLTSLHSGSSPLSPSLALCPVILQTLPSTLIAQDPQHRQAQGPRGLTEKAAERLT
jgi:hypothetical protein